MTGTDKAWGYWVSNILLILGVSFILTGIIFFFAFNWQNMIPFQKFATVLFGLFITILGALFYSSNTLILSLCLTGASVLVGVFLAIFGQVYQTGADTYQLFLIWAILIIPWALIAQFSPLWILWILLINLSTYLFWENQDALLLFLRNSDPYLYFASTIVALNCVFLFLKEKAIWLPPRWARILLSLWILMFLYVIVDDGLSQVILDKIYQFNVLYLLSLIAIGLLALFVYYYTKIQCDLAVVAMALFTGTLLICSATNDILSMVNVGNLIELYIRLVVYVVAFSLTAYILVKLNQAKHS